MTSDVVVVDASVLVDVLLDPRRTATLGAAIGGAQPIAPAHVDAEVGSALARIYRAGELTEDQVQQRLAKLSSMSIDRRHTTNLLARAWELRNYVSMVDALYVVLAEEVDAHVLTTDVRLSRAHTRTMLIDWQEH